MKKPFIEFKYRHELKHTLKGAFVMYDFRLEQFKRSLLRMFVWITLYELTLAAIIAALIKELI